MEDVPPSTSPLVSGYCVCEGERYQSSKIIILHELIRVASKDTVDQVSMRMSVRIAAVGPGPGSMSSMTTIMNHAGE